MSKQIVGIGTVANDGTGDSPRAGGIKINSNFDELYQGDEVHASTSKSALVDADEFALQDSEASNVKKKTLWSSIKAVLKIYFDGLYAAAIALNTTHRTSDGSDHSHIDQDVTTTSSPTFVEPDVQSTQYDTTPSTSDGVGKLRWDADSGTLNLGLAGGTAVLQIGEEFVGYFRNNSGSTITNGTGVMFTGTLGASARLTIGPAIMDGTYPSNYYIGLATEDILNGEDGFVTLVGKVRGLDTTGQNGETWSEGDTLYADPVNSGSLTNVSPTAPNNHITVAVVVYTHDSVGALIVRPNFQSKIGDLQDVNGTVPLSNYALLWDAVNDYWDATALTASVITDFDTAVLNAVAISITTVNAATYNVIATDKIIHVTYSSTGTSVVTIPSALIVDGFTIAIKDGGGNSGTHNITIATEGAETIDGDSTAVISGDFNSVSLYSNGTNLFIY